MQIKGVKMMYEWILLITLKDVPVIGRFKNLKECQQVARIYSTDGEKQGIINMIPYSHCIKVEK